MANSEDSSYVPVGLRFMGSTPETQVPITQGIPPVTPIPSPAAPPVQTPESTPFTPSTVPSGPPSTATQPPTPSSQSGPYVRPQVSPSSAGQYRAFGPIRRGRIARTAPPPRSIRPQVPPSGTRGTRTSPTAAGPSRAPPRPSVAASGDSTPPRPAGVPAAGLGSTGPLPERPIPRHADDRIEIENLKRMVAEKDALIAQLTATVHTQAHQRVPQPPPQPIQGTEWIQVRKRMLPISKHFLWGTNAECCVQPRADVLKTKILEELRVRDDDVQTLHAFENAWAVGPDGNTRSRLQSKALQYMTSARGRYTSTVRRELQSLLGIPDMPHTDDPEVIQAWRSDKLARMGDRNQWRTSGSDPFGASVVHDSIARAKGGVNYQRDGVLVLKPETVAWLVYVVSFSMMRLNVEIMKIILSNLIEELPFTIASMSEQMEGFFMNLDMSGHVSEHKAGINVLKKELIRSAQANELTRFALVLDHETDDIDETVGQDFPGDAENEEEEGFYTN